MICSECSKDVPLLYAGGFCADCYTSVCKLVRSRHPCLVCHEVKPHDARMVMLRGPFPNPPLKISMGHQYYVCLKCIKKLHIENGLVTELYLEGPFKPDENLAQTLNELVR